MRIGWIIPTVGIFGAVREMLELSNALTRQGHRVTIFHPDGTPCRWLPTVVHYAPLKSVITAKLDVLIGILDWEPELYEILLQATARVKAICLLGFNPTLEMARSIRGETAPRDKAERMIRDSMRRKFLILTDSSWQVDWMRREIGYPAGPAFGGVNLDMFFAPVKAGGKAENLILYSGDPRPRKGTDTVQRALELLKQQNEIKFEAKSYWNQNFTQAELVQFLQRGMIFLDGHRRAGWCNPVAEAIACGTVPVCTDIGAVRDFAVHNRTALLVPVGDAEAMAAAATKLLQRPVLRLALLQQGLDQIKQFSYTEVSKTLEQALQRAYES